MSDAPTGFPQTCVVVHSAVPDEVCIRATDRGIFVDGGDLVPVDLVVRAATDVDANTLIASWLDGMTLPCARFHVLVVGGATGTRFERLAESVCPGSKSDTSLPRAARAAAGHSRPMRVVSYFDAQHEYREFCFWNCDVALNLKASGPTAEQTATLLNMSVALGFAAVVWYPPTSEDDADEFAAATTQMVRWKKEFAELSAKSAEDPDRPVELFDQLDAEERHLLLRDMLVSHRLTQLFPDDVLPFLDDMIEKVAPKSDDDDDDDDDDQETAADADADADADGSTKPKKLSKVALSNPLEATAKPASFSGSAVSSPTASASGGGGGGGGGKSSTILKAELTRMQRENLDLQEEIAPLRAQVESLTDDLRAIREENRALVAERNSARGEAEQNDTATQASEDKLNAAHARVAIQRTEIEQLLGQLREARGAAERARNEEEDLRDQLAAAEDRNANASEDTVVENKQLRARVENTRAEMARLTQRNSELEQLQKDHAAEMATVEQALAASTTEAAARDKAAASKRAELEDTVLRLRNELEASEKKLLGFETAEDAAAAVLKTHTDRVAQLEAELAVQKEATAARPAPEEMEQLRERVIAAERDLKSLRAETDARAADLDKQLKDSRDQNKTLSDSLADLRASSTRTADEKQAALDGAIAECASLRANIEQMQIDHQESLSVQTEEIATHSEAEKEESLKQLRQALGQRRSQEQQLRKQLADTEERARAEAQELHGQMDALRAEHAAAIESENRRSADALRAVQDEHRQRESARDREREEQRVQQEEEWLSETESEKEEKLKQMRSALGQRRSQEQKLRQQLVDAEERAQNEQAEMQNAAAAEKAALEARVAALSGDLDQTRADLDATSAKLQDAQGANKELSTKLADAEMEHDLLQRKHRSVVEELAAAEATCKKTESELSEANDKLAAQQPTVDAASEKDRELAETNAALAEARTHLAELNRAHKLSCDSLADAEEGKTRVNDELERTIKNMSGLETVKQITALSGKVKELEEEVELMARANKKVHAENDAERRTNARLTMEVGRLQNEVLETSEQSKQLPGVLAELGRVKGVVTSLTLECDELKAQLGDGVDENADTAHELEDTRAALQQSEANVAQLTAELRGLHQHINSIVEEASKSPEQRRAIWALEQLRLHDSVRNFERELATSKNKTDKAMRELSQHRQIASPVMTPPRGDRGERGERNQLLIDAAEFQRRELEWAQELQHLRDDNSRLVETLKTRAAQSQHDSMSRILHIRRDNTAAAGANAKPSSSPAEQQQQQQQQELHDAVALSQELSPPTTARSNAPPAAAAVEDDDDKHVIPDSPVTVQKYHSQFIRAMKGHLHTHDEGAHPDVPHLLANKTKQQKMKQPQPQAKSAAEMIEAVETHLLPNVAAAADTAAAGNAPLPTEAEYAATENRRPATTTARAPAHIESYLASVIPPTRGQMQQQQSSSHKSSRATTPGGSVRCIYI